jgi:hypothetical protein
MFSSTRVRTRYRDHDEQTYSRDLCDPSGGERGDEYPQSLKDC